MTRDNRPPVIAYSINLNGLHHLKHHDYAELLVQHFDYWIVVEGAAMNAGSTRWCRSMPAIFHRRGRSIDGTLPFLKRLRKRYDNLRLVTTRGMWPSKDAMVNAAVDELRQLTGRCILFQIDIDEQWTAEGIDRATAEMIESGAKTAAFHANHYVGKDVIAVGVEPFLRVSNWSGERYLSHEPPMWENGNLPTITLSHRVEHYSYYFPQDVQFKDKWYGSHAGIYKRWLRLQREKHFPQPQKHLFPYRRRKPGILIKNRDRPLRRAEWELAKNPRSSRSYWMTGKALKDLARNDEAIALFRKVLRAPRSGPEVYFSKLGLAECYWRQGRHRAAFVQARSALRARPQSPEAYFVLGDMCAESSQFQTAIEMYGEGLTKARPHHTLRAYGPRFYDLSPMTQLTEIYLKLRRPDLALPLLESCLKVSPRDAELQKNLRLTRSLVKTLARSLIRVRELEKIPSREVLREALEQIPDDLKTHPAVCALRNTRLIKRRSSGRDLVIFCGDSIEHWTPQTVRERGSSAGEEAVIRLAALLAELGWHVTVYTNSGYLNEKVEGVTYKSSCLWNYRDRQDVVILWQQPACLDLDIHCDRIFVDVHDTASDVELTAERLGRVRRVFLKSAFQRKLLSGVPDDKCEIIPHGIDSTLFAQPVERDPYLIVNTSYPGKCLAVLTEIFAEVKLRVPQARLQWAYGWDLFDLLLGDRADAMEWKRALKRRMHMAGVEERGRIRHAEVARMYLQANVWAHPTTFAETGCISMSKALAAGAMTITTDFGDPGERHVGRGVFIPTNVTAETWRHPSRYDYSITNPQEIRQWTESLIDLLENPPGEESRHEIRQYAQQTYDWRKIAARWGAVLRS